MAETQAVRIGIAFRHQDAEHFLGSESGDGKRRRDAVIDASRETEHHAATPQKAQHLDTHRSGNARGPCGCI